MVNKVLNKDVALTEIFLAKFTEICAKANTDNVFQLRWSVRRIRCLIIIQSQDISLFYK